MPSDDKIPTDNIHHHLYRQPSDLVPYCGVTPGPDKDTGVWHTGHDLETLLQALEYGLPSCITCLSPEALGGWTPVVMEEETR